MTLEHAAQAAADRDLQELDEAAEAAADRQRFLRVDSVALQRKVRDLYVRAFRAGAQWQEQRFIKVCQLVEIQNRDAVVAALEARVAMLTTALDQKANVRK